MSTNNADSTDNTVILSASDAEVHARTLSLSAALEAGEFSGLAAAEQAIDIFDGEDRIVRTEREQIALAYAYRATTLASAGS